MAVQMTPEQMDNEVNAALLRVRDITGSNRAKDNDALFTETVAWGTIIMVYLDTLSRCGDSRASDLFETVTRKTFEKAQAIMSEHGDDERRAARGE